MSPRTVAALVSAATKVHERNKLLKQQLQATLQQQGQGQQQGQQQGQRR
jgi:hypothetical protein